MPSRVSVLQVGTYTPSFIGTYLGERRDGSDHKSGRQVRTTTHACKSGWHINLYISGMSALVGCARWKVHTAIPTGRLHGTVGEERLHVRMASRDGNSVIQLNLTVYNSRQVGMALSVLYLSTSYIFQLLWSGMFVRQVRKRYVWDASTLFG